MRNTPSKTREPSADSAQIAGQLEDLLHLVWECERWWSLEDRLDLAARIVIADRNG